MCCDLIAPQFHINIANAIQKMTQTMHFHFQPLSSQNSFLSEKQKKIHKCTHIQVCTIILYHAFQRYHTPLLSIPLNKYPPLKKKNKKIHPTVSNFLVKKNKGISYGISCSTQQLTRKTKKIKHFPLAHLRNTLYSLHFNRLLHMLYVLNQTFIFFMALKE